MYNTFHIFIKKFWRCYTVLCSQRSKPSQESLTRRTCAPTHKAKLFETLIIWNKFILSVLSNISSFVKQSSCRAVLADLSIWSLRFWATSVVGAQRCFVSLWLRLKTLALQQRAHAPMLCFVQETQSGVTLPALHALRTLARFHALASLCA